MHIPDGFLDVRTAATSGILSAAGIALATRGLKSIPIPSQYHSNWMDNAAAKFDLGWRPRIDLPQLIDLAYDYRRMPGDPRKIWYVG